jgi:hypothetical protein
MPEAVNEDRRRCGRVRVELPLTLSLDPRESRAQSVLYETTTIDCSDQGARIIANLAGLKPGNTLSLKLKGNSEEVVPGRVVWVHPPGPNGVSEVGVQFLSGAHLRYEV